MASPSSPLPVCIPNFVARSNASWYLDCARRVCITSCGSVSMRPHGDRVWNLAEGAPLPLPLSPPPPPPVPPPSCPSKNGNADPADNDLPPTKNVSDPRGSSVLDTISKLNSHRHIPPASSPPTSPSKTTSSFPNPSVRTTF